MEKLSLDAINAKSEYIVKMEVDNGTYSFMTDNMAEIFISFEKDDILQSGIVYQFGISNPKGTKSPRDHKVRETILAIIEEFFNKNKAALLYICETGDGMQRMRSRFSNTGLVYTMRKLIICFFLRLFMMMKITKIMQH